MGDFGDEAVFRFSFLGIGFNLRTLGFRNGFSQPSGERFHGGFTS